MNKREPFGYFRAEPFGWTDCAETDEGAIALYDQATISDLEQQRDELLAAMKKLSGMKLNIIADGIIDKAIAKAKESP